MTADCPLDPIKIGNKGHFISIDGRPVSTTRGIFKDFAKLYKAYYRYWLSLTAPTDSFVDPFLCLHLRCPVGSYDVNIEPAKDEVLFTDNRCVLGLLENFLKTVYGDLPEKTDYQGSRNKGSASSNSKSQSFGLLLAEREHPFSERPKNASEFNQGSGMMRRSDGQDQKELDVESETPAANELPELGHIDNTRSDFEHPLHATARPHRNMYDFDEDDLSTIDPPPSPEQAFLTAADDAEVRKASVTNPWAIAKLNATVSSARSPSSGARLGTSNEQLMTPGPDSTVNDLVFKSHRKPFVPIPELSSPARSNSSRSSPVYQNPGPPLRRRGPVRRFEEDDIDFTQESANERSTHNHPISLELWATPKARDVQLPSFQGALDVAEKDRCFGPRDDQGNNSNEDVKSEMQSTQLTDPAEELDQTLLSRSGIRKPSTHSFKTPDRLPLLHPPMKLTRTASSQSEQHSPTRPPWARNQEDAQSTSPVSHAHPPPLFQSHRHPMESPPRLQPSPVQPAKSPRQTNHTSHPDLDEIMDFEHRKKAVNAQRKNQSKLTNRYLNPAQLAQMQRESTASQASERVLGTSGPCRKQSQASLNVRYDTETSHNSTRPIGTSASDQNLPLSQEPVNSPSQKQSPHQNRYEAAKAALTRQKPVTPLSHVHPPTEPDSTPEAIDSTKILPRLPDEDPRAYLIQHRDTSPRHANGHNQNMIQGLTRTGLKIKRTKRCKLHFESIPPESATHNISVRPLISFPSLNNLAAQINELGRVDPYSRTGNNHLVVWDPNSKDVPAWESSILALVRVTYTTKVGGGEEVPANLQLRLGVALRAHCEEFA
jgi:DNA mismatch repair ATPase MutL